MSTEDDKRLLIRLDERFRILTEKIDDLVEALDKTREEFRKDFVTQKEFNPVKRAVYSAIGLVAVGFGGLIMVLFGLK